MGGVGVVRGWVGVGGWGWGGGQESAEKVTVAHF